MADGPTYTASKPKMPKDLPQAAKDEWKRLVKQLERRGSLTSVDGSQCEIYVRLFAQWKALCLEVEKDGPMIDDVVLDKDGEQVVRRVQNPAMKLANQISAQLRMLLKELGSTPASRESVKPTAPKTPKVKKDRNIFTE